LFLKRIKISGFKSFARTLIINFDSPLTAIVGPNGSGKSNIVDAIRWAIGEQSAKTLRGSRMSDVIFAGSESHKALDKAEVTIYFNNSDRVLDIDKNNVSISRRVNDSGESDYLINNKICRKKDIDELLLDTGIGRDSYSIIGQGKIDSIINSKPEVLRVLFEEAAGITKHKQRKEETLKKLDRTKRDLQRVEDLIWELEKQLAPLKKEVKKTKKFKRLKDELDRIEQSYYYNRWYIYNEKMNKTKLNIDDLKEKLKYEENKYKELEKLSHINIVEKESIENKLNNRKENLQLNKSKENEANNNVKILTERKNSLLREKKDLIFQIEEWEKKLANYYSSKKEITENINKFQKKENNIEDKISLKNKAISLLMDDIKEKKDMLSLLRNNIFNDDDKLNELKTRRDRLEEKSKYTELKIEGSINKRNQYDRDYKEIITESSKLENNLDELKNNINIINLQLKKLKDERGILKKDISNIDKKIKDTNDEINKKKSRLSFIKEQKNSMEGYYRGVKNYLKNSDDFDGFVGVVADLLKVEKKYEKAIETSLGSKMQNIVVKDDLAAKEGINFLKKNNAGRATFLPLNMVKGKKLNLNKFNLDNFKGYCGLAMDLLTYDNNIDNVIKYLLGSTIVVADIEASTLIAKYINNRLRIVTLDGDVISRSGAITGGSRTGNNISILSRSREINDLKKELQRLIETKDNLMDSFNNKNQKLENIELKLKNLEESLNKIKFKKDYLLEKINTREKEKNIIMTKISELDEEFASYHDELGSIDREKEEIINKLKNMEKDFTYEQKDITNRETEINNLETDFYNLKDELSSLKIELTKVIQKRKNMLNEFKRFSGQIEDNEEKINISKEKINNIDLKLKKIDKKIIDLKNNIEIYIKNINKLKKECDKLEIELIIKVDKKSSLEDRMISSQNNISVIKEDFHKINLKIERYDYKINDFKSRLKEKFDRLPENMDSESMMKIKAPGEINAKISELKNSIKQLGEVNTKAIKEHENLNKRYVFLENQRDDLIKAKESILAIIKDVDNIMGEMFFEAYLQVKEEFEVVFKDLFTGGKAELILTNADDLLNTGVEISAQPPGKKLKKLSLMSGGERALTAIALLFAFLKVNPGPFYILDEIDAALDDANVVRFAEFINRYSKYVQFVIITHRRYMMNEIDSIYGISMEESGISKLVSLKVNEMTY